MRVRVCVLVEMEKTLWMRHFEQHSTGESEGSQTAFWDIIQPPTQQMCCSALSLPQLSLGLFLLGKHHLEFAVLLCFQLSLLWVCYLLCSIFGFLTLLVNTLNTSSLMGELEVNRHNIDI